MALWSFWIAVYHQRRGTDAELEPNPCNEDSPTPAAILEDQAIYLAQPLNSIQTITVQITYDDETTDTVTYARNSVLIP